ncbi:hypothetical protein J5I95_12830 [Candidatus Poribacteria bacterium]|nr:hypothetical protein [Candidatus Poribacteria bacterium]
MKPLILILLILSTVSIAFGAVEIADVTFGFNGAYKTGTWVPLRITVQSQEQPTTLVGELVVEVRSFSSDTPIARYASKLQLSTIETPPKDLYIYCPKNATQLIVQFVPQTSAGNAALNNTRVNGMQEVSLPTPLSRKDYFVLVLAQSGDKLKRFIDKKQLADLNDSTSLLNDSTSLSDSAQVHVEYLPHSNRLPRDWIGYNAVDVLVIRETVLTERSISKARQTALLDWVQQGGTLIMSGGSSFNTLRGSFIEPFLPVKLKGLKQIDTRLDALPEQFGFQSSGSNSTLFEYIEFVPKAGCETLIGTVEHIYVAKRKFGDGQILCFAFDYNAPPFGENRKNIEEPEQQVGETFWREFLGRHGKSPRHLADQYALALQHEEKIHKQFLLKMPTQVPLIKLLSIVLPVYLLSFGGFLFYFRKAKRRRLEAKRCRLEAKQNARTYWIGGCLFVLISVSVIVITRNVLPNSTTADRLSILSVYPERGRAHLQSYVSLRTTARTEMSIDFPKGTFIRHQESEALSFKIEGSGTETSKKIGTLIQDLRIQLRGLLVEPWHPTTYVKETFLNTQQLPRMLENAWYVVGKEMTYLGDIALDAKPELFQTSLWLQVSPEMPPDEKLSGIREKFAQILGRERVLRYLATETNLPPYLIGWTSEGLTDIAVDGNVNTNDETLVIYPL